MRFLLAAILSGFILTLKSQENHFIYIQTEDQQSFYLRDENALNASSESGFIIIPKVIRGIQSFVIGFPRNQWPPHQFYIEVNNRDRGFALKIIDSKAWGLLDLQTSEVIMGSPLESMKKQDLGKQNLATDSFSVMLSKSVDDPQLLDQNLIRKDSISAKSNEKFPPIPVVKDSIDKTTPVNAKNTLGKILVEQLKVSVSDSISGKKKFVDKVLNDTITIEAMEHIPMLAKEVPSKQAVTDSAKSRCATLATDIELQSLRRKLLMISGEEKMHEEAVKALNEKCFSTRMFRSIANVFTSDKGRIKLMEAAYTLVYDPANFPMLEILLSDSSSLKKFQQLIKSR